MTGATYHDQHRSAGRPEGAAIRIAASRARHTCTDQSNSPARQSILPHRATCRSPRAPAFFFAPVSIDADEIHELRLCGLNGRQPVLARLRALDTGHHVLQDNADVPECHSSNPSRVRVFDEKHRSERITHRAGSITQGLGNV